MSETLPDPVPADAVTGQGDPAFDHNEAVTALNQVISYLNNVGPAGTPQATAAVFGTIRLSGDLAGTADFPRVQGLTGKVSDTDARLSDARTPTLHGSSHEEGGADELTVTQAQVVGLSDALANAGGSAGRVWDSGSQTWSARPTGTTGPVSAYSTDDPAATAPPSAVTGDLWFRHPAST